jgi:DNA segregation ATPase FtsK/SpoIIIE-like protein
MSEIIHIDRPPRIQPELPFDEIEIPAPPDKQENGHARLIQIALPMITIIGYVLVSAFGGGRNPWLLIPMGLSVVASTAFGFYSYRKEKQRRAEIEEAYTERLIELNKEMHNYHDMQRRFYRYNYPDSPTTFRIVQNARAELEKAERSLRSEVRLWERREDDKDFGVVRLGMGTLPSTVTYVLGNVDNFDDPQVREAMKLASDSQYVDDIPVIVSLRQPPEDDNSNDDGKEDKEEVISQTPITHALGVAGAREAVYPFVHALLCDYVVFHAPMNARLYVVGTDSAQWKWTETLPHSRADEQNRYCCFTNEIKTAPDKGLDDDDGGELEKFLEGIRKVLSQRKIQLQERDRDEGGGDPTLPLLVVVVDLLDATYDKSAALHMIETHAAISILLEEGAMLGASVLFLVPERGKIPSGCKSVVEIEKTTPATNSKNEQHQRLHFRYTEIGVNTFRYVGEADHIATLDEMSTLAQQLRKLEVRQGSGANLPGSVSFLQLMGWDSLPTLRSATLTNWQRHSQHQYANWLRVKLGVMSGNKPRKLVFSAKGDGVHGMVAGSTGSGKSELLVSLIVGLAVTYDPSVLNFVLVDYKGGGAFNDFKELPHCVDIITNLDGNGITRMFTAIGAEINRRQALIAQTGANNIVDYRRRGLHETRHGACPFLFIIIDEFAEMIAERAEYRSELERITRVGRSLGVSLVLAAQRPSGVTDQMRSNIKFRICLRVETQGESREMLRRSDAAFLPPGIPGRGYLQVGNEEIELIQVAYTGDMYLDPGQSPQAKVLWPGRHYYDTSQEKEPVELYKAIVSSLQEMNDQAGIPKQRAPWPDTLPTELTLSGRLAIFDPAMKANRRIPAITFEEYLDQDDIDHMLLGRPRERVLTLNASIQQWSNDKCGWVDPLDWKTYAMRPVVGLVDNPYEARQQPLIVDLQHGHVAVFGAFVRDKTMFLRTLVMSLAATHSPAHLNVYVLDLGGRNLRVLEELPHVGAMILPDEEGYKERVEQLLRELDDIIEKRKTTINNARLEDMYQYNQAYPATPLAGIVVVIDNFLEFTDTFGRQQDDVESVLDKLIGLARQSRPYGIHFVISLNQPGDMSNQVFSLFSERFAMKLTDPADYRLIVGDSMQDIPDIAGRGYAKIGRQALSFQTASPIELPAGNQKEGANEIKELEFLAGKMQQYIDDNGLSYDMVRVDALPRSVFFKNLLVRELGLRHGPTFLDELQQHIEKQWKNSQTKEHADWLKVTLGVMAGNKPRTLYMKANQDGVHGMIAGGTGAGKSELLMSMIVGLVLNYDPSILNFVLVDYKGGGTFAAFERLPHCVDMVTNLNKAGVRRMFTAIRAEMDRRQALNSAHGVSDIIAYREKGYHLSGTPYPHLFIIIDEYAEMITDNPEFRDELDSITRVGRSIGVNLILASQRPTGVSDQMRANIALRICLRVEGADTSREMLRRSDAAFLPAGMPGRGYVQVGNQNIQLIQVAYAGDKYALAPPNERGEPPVFYEVVVNMARTLAAGRKPGAPWPPPLPRALTLAQPLIPEYITPETRALVTLGRPTSNGLTLNSFAQDWLNGTSVWPGVDWQANAMRAVVGLMDDPYAAQQHPLEVNLARGHAVIFGASGWGKTTFLRTMVHSLAATHSPDEFHAHVLDLGGRYLEVLNNLPHVGTVITPDERGYEERVQQLWRALNEMLNERKRTFGSTGETLYEYNRNQVARGEPTEPAVLVIIDNFTEFIETFGDMSKKASSSDGDNLLETFILLARQGKGYGLHFAISANRLNALSSKLYSLFTERFTLRLSDANDYSAIVGGQVAEVQEVMGRGYTRRGRQPLSFQVALPPGAIDEKDQVSGEAQQIRAMGQQMDAFMQRNAAHRYREPLCIDALPTSSSYRQVLTDVFGLSRQDEAFLDELKLAVQKKWLENRMAEEPKWLHVPLGVISGNRPRTLHLEALEDGVHGMIAGGTGSGKSEVLTTLIVGLALHYPPDLLNFVLVDFKGGGAFRAFEKLPHCVEIVTNLGKDKAAVARMFTAINAEIRRRQALNTETGTKDIIAYRKQRLHLDSKYGPYPHLFIIIDEYAEMIEQYDEYRTELDSITRVGRSLGINLFLASQRPKGVSDQMRANIKLRLCLRVEQTDTSQELLRRPDAALLPSGMPGRGYLQVGNGGLELVQVAYTGEKQPDNRISPVEWPNRPPRPARISGEEPPCLYDMAVKLAQELTSGQMAPKPWPGFLPEQFSLESALVDAQRNDTFVLQSTVTDWINNDTAGLWSGIDWRKNALRPIVGLVDDPVEARQFPLQFDLKRNHLAVFGDAGMGKTTLLRTLLLSLAATHTPAEFQAYVLDLGGRSFRNLQMLPHVGAVIYADEEAYEERQQRLVEMLGRMTDERQQIISEASADDLYEFNARYPDQALPAVVVVIDNFAELQENHTRLMETLLLPLLRRSLRVGVSFVVTSNTPMMGKIYNLFSERMTFRQLNADRYIEIVGRGAIEIDEIPGRAYIREGRRPLLCHIAQPVGLGVDTHEMPTEADELKALAHHMHEYLDVHGIAYTAPDQISILSEHLLLADVLDKVAAPTHRIEAVLGENADLQPAIFDLKRLGPHCVVLGPPLSGKTVTMRNWVLSLATRYAPERVMFILIDRQRTLFEYGGKHRLGELPHVLAAVSEEDQIKALAEHLKQECELLSERQTPGEIFVMIDNYDDFAAEIEKNHQLSNDFVGLARRYGRDGLHFILAGTPNNTHNLRRIAQSANYGIGLRSESALSALSAMRIPAVVRERELPVGRGYIVKSGQTTMIQIASPCETPSASLLNSDALDDEERMADALDGWVEQICAQYPDQQAAWSVPMEQPEDAVAQNGAPAQNAKIVRMQKLLLAGAHREFARAHANNGANDMLLGKMLPQIDQVNLRDHDEESLMVLLREMYLKETVASGLPHEQAVSLLEDMDTESLLGYLENTLS